MKINKYIEVPEYIMEIIEKLNTIPNTTSLVVGGAVRDALMNKEPNDWDVATNVPMDIIEKMFPSHDIGKNKDFGIFIAETAVDDVEIANFRTDGKDRDDDNITIVNDFETDSNRRDFTINAMGYDPIKEVIYDYHGGMDDIKNNIIKFVGNGYDRIIEDPLRMLRAIRFACAMKCNISEEDKEAITFSKEDINRVSKERIYKEFRKSDSKMGNVEFGSYILNLMNLKVFKEIFKNCDDNKITEFLYHSFTNNVKYHDRVALFLSYVKGWENMPIDNKTRMGIKAINSMKNKDFYSMSDYEIFTQVYTHNSFDYIRDYMVGMVNERLTYAEIIKRTELESYFDDKIDVIRKYKDIRKKYNGKYIMDTYNVTGKDVGIKQREVLKEIIDNGEI